MAWLRGIYFRRDGARPLVILGFALGLGEMPWRCRC